MEQATIRRWRQLERRWWKANQSARKAQGVVRLAYEEFLLGGRGPTRAQLRTMDERQRRADECRLWLDGLVLCVMTQEQPGVLDASPSLPVRTG